MPHYFPMPADPTAMPVDISFVFSDEKPAGKHGFLKVVGEDMRFEDGTLGKFWGVNINGGACFPSHEYAQQFARRLAEAGCNVVRFHQLDAEFGTPNIFQFTKGKRITTTRQLDAQSMERLDYLVYCLKEAGIYMYLDLLTYRQFKTGDGVKFANHLKPAAKPWCYIDPTLIELQKEYATQLWTHYNPYTGLCYKDDPAFILTEIVNECDLFITNGTVQYSEPAYYVTQMREMFRDWLAANGKSYDWENCSLLAQDQELIDFKLHLTYHYYSTMYQHMRDLGVKIPITGTNWIVQGYDYHLSHKDMDFTDTHAYIATWNWGKNRSQLHKAITEMYSLPHLSNVPRSCVAGKPTFFSEWDMCWPNPYRAECSIYYAALACLHNWSGLAMHTYSYNTRISRSDLLGQENTTAIGNSLGREGMFTVWNDWARFGLYPHAAMMLRRGDLMPSTQKLAIKPENMRTNSNIASQDALDICKAAVTLDGSLPDGYDKVIPDSEPVPTSHKNPNVRVACTGQLTRNLVRQQGIVDSDRTKAVFGKLCRPAAGVELKDMKFKSTTEFGVVAISSLTDAPIRESDNMLLTAIGKVRNTDQVFDGEILTSFGKLPIVAELIEATITLKTCYPNDIKIWGINADGSYVGSMPVTVVDDETITFSIGNPGFPACYYLIFRE